MPKEDGSFTIEELEEATAKGLTKVLGTDRVRCPECDSFIKKPIASTRGCCGMVWNEEDKAWHKKEEQAAPGKPEKGKSGGFKFHL